jgi:hypothetical protein|tara:strand:+ start:1613 stop:1807 length:195 start_codon:yes stop_codon:yes gene_type:complete
MSESVIKEIYEWTTTGEYSFEMRDHAKRVFECAGCPSRKINRRAYILEDGSTLQFFTATKVLER